MSRTLSAVEFEAFATLLKSRSGLAIGFDKLYLLETRLAPILRQHGLRDLAALAHTLRGPGSESLSRLVVEAMTTNESFFFRDDRPFAHVRKQALPHMLAARSPGSQVRIWSSAASAGQEAYSLAMILDEHRAQIGDRRVEIIGTDIARDQLARAEQGLYTQFEIQRGVPMQLLVRYFRKEESGWRVAEKLRAMVQFREWNLLSDLRPLGLFDIVFCRNVLIYFDQPTKTRVLDAIARQIQPDGLLYLGAAETVLGLSDRFEPVPGERGIYALAKAAAPKASARVLVAAR
jgi:chemotaxis protein methyltransferase CheR